MRNLAQICCRMQSTGWHLSWCFSKYKSEHLRNCPSRGICPQRTSCSSNSWCQGISMTNKKSQFLVWGPLSLLNLPSPERYLCRTSYMATGKAGQSSEDPSPAPCGTGWEDSFVTWQWYLPLLPMPKDTPWRERAILLLAALQLEQQKPQEVLLPSCWQTWATKGS